ncbi:MAG: outer membrane protein [Anderseniella sp.]|jgi:outer membrane immunogenic protein|nr:outer membrane protein [Anderseniella sp.]
MKKLLVSMFALGAFTAPAMAADLYTPMEPIPFSWNGLYVGGHIGYGWGDKDWTLVENAGNEPSNRIGDVVTSHDVDGILGGVQLGYNHQINSIVIGAEVEFSWTGIDGTGEWLAEGGNPDTPERNASADINWLLTVGPKLGFAMERTLFYAEGGLAVADEDFSHLGNNNNFYTGSDTRTGWFIGAGAEHAFDDNWSARVEYNYVDLGSSEVSVSREADGGTRTAIFDVDQDLHVIKVGLNYRF